MNWKQILIETVIEIIKLIVELLSLSHKGVLEISCQSDKIQILRVENARRKTNRF